MTTPASTAFSLATLPVAVNAGWHVSATQSGTRRAANLRNYWIAGALKRYFSVMNRALARVQRVTEELEDIQVELFETGVRKEGNSPPFIDDPACLDVLSAFKARVDDLRRLLFFFVNNLTMEVGDGQNQTIHAYRLRRATELLDVLSRPPMLVLSGEEQVLLARSLKKFLATYKAGNNPSVD